jgi:hypothetical protein
VRRMWRRSRQAGAVGLGGSACGSCSLRRTRFDRRERADHLGYERDEAIGRGSGNSRAAPTQRPARGAMAQPGNRPARAGSG